MALAAIPFGVSIGIAVGLLGGGGSVLAVPVLVYVLQQDVETATTTSLVVVTAAAVAGGYRHALSRRICWRHAGAFTVPALPGIVAGTALGDAVTGTALVAGFAVIMLAAAAATWRKASAAEPPDDGRQAGTCPALRLGRDIAAGFVVGLLTGFFGVGGGFIIVPTLAVALSFSMRAAIGTSLAIITTTSVLGVAVHLAAGRTLPADLTLAMGAACIAGALLGAQWSMRVSQQVLGRSFAGLVVAVARLPARKRRLPRRPTRFLMKASTTETMHNVAALNRTIANGEADPDAAKQKVHFDGEWQTDGGPQFGTTIPAPNGDR